MGAFKDFFTKLFEPLTEAPRAAAIGILEGTQSVDMLESHWDSLVQARRDDPAVKAAYDKRKKELTDAGLLVRKNRVLGYLGEQVANAVWAITEHALPNILSWINQTKTAYTDRADDLARMNKEQEDGTFGISSVLGTDDLAAMTKMGEAGEFGLNAMVNLLLRATVYPSVRAFGQPFWEDWEHQAWAYHPAKIPSVSDLVRMEYREVFRPQFRKELIEDEPISADFKTLMAQVGYSKAHAENYWGAHWQLPGTTQGYEMYHRLRPAMTIDKYNLPATYSKPFELDDLNTLLKRQDVLKRYRDQLVEIAYKPFTRVDVRRMYRAGVLSFEEVIAAYLDVGYSPDRALKMAEFTKAWVTEGVEKRETKGGILDAMKTGIISEAEAETELGAFYPDDVAKRYVDIAKVKNKLNKGDVAWLLGHESMDESEARDRFAEMGYPPDDIDYLIIRYSPEEASM